MATMGRAIVWCLCVVLAPAAHAADAVAKYQAPRNEYGQPDLRGVWNFSSDVPLQRPKDTPDKQFQTREDIAKSNAARQKQFEQLAQQGVGFHNDFWLDYKSQVENLRNTLADIEDMIDSALEPLEMEDEEEDEEEDDEEDER